MITEAVKGAEANRLDQIGQDVDALLSTGRYDLLELCTPPDSRLSAHTEALGGQVFRMGLHNGFDLATETGQRRAVIWVQAHKPRRVVMSPPCTADCTLQALNQSTEEQRQNHRVKVLRARKIQRGCRRVMSAALAVPGTDVDLEQPAGSRSWTLSKDMQEMRDQMHETLVEGCAYGLRDRLTGQLIKKPWRICTTDYSLTTKLNKSSVYRHLVSIRAKSEKS